MFKIAIKVNIVIVIYYEPSTLFELVLKNKQNKSYNTVFIKNGTKCMPHLLTHANTWKCPEIIAKEYTECQLILLPSL